MEIDLVAGKGDLAPGDHRSAQFNWQGFDRIQPISILDPIFKLSYERLWREFGEKGELEKEDVLSDRMKWNPSEIDDGYSYSYFMNVIMNGSDWVAVRDHTVISSQESSSAIVHLSHVLIDPRYRRTGLAGWLRAWPVQHARWALRAAGLPENSPITLVAEMEGDEPLLDSQIARLKSYQKSGFLMVDSETVSYYQPDFRPPAVIDDSGGPQPVPLKLVIRRVGREIHKEVSGAEITHIVSALYKMYEKGFRRRDMQELWKSLRTHYPSPQARVKLVKPYEKN